jgi:diguanylate cyclase (GGDEF)-like protein
LQPSDALGDLLEIGKQIFATQSRWRGEVTLRRKDGSVFPAALSLAVVRDDQGVSEKLIGVFSDITLLKRQQQALETLAYYDALTQLPNRVLFADRFARAMARARREKRLLAVCYLDLDGFKQVNDTYGHEMGDALLIEASKRIRQTLREDDTVSRLGGDEFALLLEGLETEVHCRQAIERLQQALAAPYHLRGQEIAIGVSTGITLYPRDDGDADSLLRHADQAMYYAKTRGRNRYCFFDPDADAPAPGTGAP